MVALNLEFQPYAKPTTVHLYWNITLKKRNTLYHLKK